MNARLLLAAAAVMALAVLASRAQATARDAAPPPAATNAHGPVLLPVPGDPTISIRVAFRTGSQDDPAGKEGLAQLTAVLMAEGATRKHAYPEILQLLYPMATGYGVRVDKELITFSGRVHRDHAAAFAGLLLDALCAPAFDPADFTRLKQRTRDGIEKRLRYASDEELGKQAFYGAVFAGTPYGHLDAGTLAGLDAITLDDVRAFHAAHFTRDNLVLAVGGGYDAAFVKRLEQGLATLPAGRPAATPAPAPAPLEGRRALIVKKPGPATAISFGFPIAAKRGTRDFYALWLANSWLGEHRNSSSHLYQVIREARGMNYGDYSYIEPFPGGDWRNMPPTNLPRRQQLFEVWVRPVPNAQAHFALRAAVREVEHLARHGLTQEQFALTRDFLTKYTLHFAESTDDRLGYALDDRLYGLAAPGHLANFRRIVPTLTRDEVNAAVKRYLDPGKMLIAMVSENADSLAEALATEAPSPITYATPKPAEVLAEDQEIAKHPLGLKREAIRVVPVEQMFER